MKRLLILLPVLLLLLIPSMALAEDYTQGENVTLYAHILYGDGTPANNATVSLTVYNSSGGKLLDAVNMTYIIGSNGLYAYNWTAPMVLGVYIQDVVSANPTGYGTMDFHVIAPPLPGNYTVYNYTTYNNYTNYYNITGANASAFWGYDISGMTSLVSPGGILYDLFGGTMFEGTTGIIQIIFISVLLAFAILRKGWIRIILSISIIIWGTFAMQYDIKIAAPLLAVAALLFIQAIIAQIQHAREER